MLNAHYNIDNMWAHFEVMVIEEECRLAVRITTTGLDAPICEFYSADRYAQAKKRFEDICKEIMLLNENK